METVTITLPDRSTQEREKGVTPGEIAKFIGEGLARQAVAAEVNGRFVDLDRPVEEDSQIRILTLKDEDGMYVLRHSCAHVLAQAVKRLYPRAKPTIGPVIEHGFYYDFDDLDISDNDLPKIEEEMRKIVKEAFPTKRADYRSADEAKADFPDNPYKQEIIEEYREEGLSRYDQGEFYDLCRGPHVPHTGWCKAFRLTKTAQAYWRGDSDRKQLTRIYGLSFAKQSDLDAHVKLMEEAARRDHRKLGRELGLFMFHDHSPGAPFFLPKGTIVYNALLELMREEYRRRGYEEVITPLLYDKELWQTSGHWEHYKEHMFLTEGYSLKPMNCPSHMLIYMSESRSYRDLPLRIADFAPLHRNELSGTLSGLTRVRKFSQDDAHVFCTEEQLADELNEVMDFVKYVYTDVFRLDYTVELSTRPEKFMGAPELWERAESTLSGVLEALDIPFTVNPGDGAFYGPKIDIHVRDALGRSHQCATVQLDFQMPRSFRAVYEGTDGRKHTPVMIHRAILGSLERFFGMIVEHYAGRFPLWLSPEQIRVLPIADRHNAHAATVIERLRAAGFRVTLDDRSLTTGKKVREAELERVNYILVIGDREAEGRTVNVRTRENKILGELQVEKFISQIIEERTRKD